jgi:hypothetical protein
MPFLTTLSLALTKGERGRRLTPCKQVDPLLSINVGVYGIVE